MKNKKSIITLLLVLCIGLVGLTIAYFSNSQTLNNLFSTKEYATTYTEEFVSPDNWLPGDTTDKTVIATNTGQVDQAVRISLSEEWKSKSGDTLSGLIDSNGLLTDEEENSEKAAIINFSDNNDWTYDNGYYYYNYRLAPNESTSSLIDSVTFNPKVTLGDNCVENETASGKTITCNSSSNDYDNTTYKLTINIETVQYNKYATAWSTDVAIAETKQRMLKGLKVNVADATFDTGDKTAMFEFSHPATEQTPALTDYRYIGHIPNNYVKFNCDNDGTNCEIWRIIGVFSVDDGTGNWEQRIKLVRGSAFAETMQWDSNNVNEWSTASLNLFLNGDYLIRDGDASTYGLKELAQLQIDYAIFYLGNAINSASTVKYGSTDELYDFERGIDTFNPEISSECNYAFSDNGKCINRTILIKEKVSLMYPSDYGYVYSKGIDDICYNNPYNCSDEMPWGSEIENPGFPKKGWIYNSNRKDGQLYLSSVSLLTPVTNYSASIMTISDVGIVYNVSSNSGTSTRPVVYLKSSIQITGGEGTEQNPYTLSNP